MSEAGSATKRHNPVDSICRKIKTIQMRDQDSNPNLQIPKFQSRNFDSPQSSTKKNLEEVLKNRTVKNTDRDLVLFSSPNYGLSPDMRVASPCVRPIPDSDSPLGNATYSINMASKEKFTRVWPSARTQSCSTPMVFPRELSFKYPQSVLPVSECRNLLMDDRIIPSTHSFYLADRKSETVPLQSPVVKRLSMSEAGLRRVAENKMEATSEVSLICEEDLLNSIFYACDTDHRGKVAVSKIVDYLRHTTSRGSEDSGLDELCNMLDPECQDISMDLDTYHAIMKEWIDDCRNNCADKTKDSIPGLEDSVLKLREGLMAVRRISGTLNVTSGSLEAFGGDVSRGDLETSDLITCVADLQYNNQKLQEQHHKMKTTIEALEETNHRLVEENEELRSQWKSAQQSITRVRSLKDELEEMKISMSTSEEKKAQMAFQNKQLEKDNLSLIHKISSLQEENTRNMLEAEEMRKATSEFSDKIADLQLQLSDSETTFQKKDASLHMKDLYIEELRSTLMEYNSVIENLRIEKTKLENSLQHMEQELLSNGIASPVTFKLNRLIAGSLNSLHSELELAQQLPEVSGDLMYHSGEPGSSLDITLDREVLLLLQGPGHEQLAAEFKAIVQNLLEDTCTMSDVVPLSLQRLMDSHVNGAALPGRMLEVIKSDLKEKRNIWTEKLKQLEKHKESMDKEFVKMAGNLRRIKTEQLHMRKELSSRLHELGTVRQQEEEAEGKAEGLLTQLQESSAQNDRFTKQIEELQSSLSAAWSQAESLKHRLEDSECEQRQLQATNQDLTSDHRTIQEQAKEQQKTIRSLQEKLFKGQLCGLLCQTCSDWDEGLFSTLNAAQSPSRKEKKNSSSKRFCIQDTSRLGRSHKTSLRTDPRCLYTPLLDALTLEILQLYPRLCSRSYPNARTRSPRSESSKHKDQTNSATSRGALLILNKCESVSVGIQTDAGDSVNGHMEDVPFEVLGSEHRVADNICRLDITSQTAADGLSSSLENTLISSEPDAELCVMEASDASGKERETAASEGSLDPDLQVKSTPDSSTTRTAVTEDTEFKTQQHQSIPNKEIPPAESLTGSLNAILDENHCSNSEKEMETEFLRLSLGFKCDLFTLEKRLRLEERSRDLAEENLKKEIASCVKLLEALTPLCEEDNQTYEIVKKLEKSLRFLSQHSARVASRAEMLGAIHQESRVSKAVDVMIQHVENLKRMYTKEHAELEELKELIQQNELPRPSTDRDELHKLPTLLNTKPPARRVSMPAYPRGMISGSPADLFGTEKLDGKIHKRSNSWKVVGTKHADSRPILQRFVANYTRTEPAEENSIKEDEQYTEIADDIKDEKRLSVSTESNLPPTETHSVFTQAKLWVSTLKNSVSNINKPMVISLLAALLLAVLVSFLTGLSFQQPVDGAPVGTGDSWTSIQQLLWPYTGLRHNGQPPV